MFRRCLLSLRAAPVLALLVVVAPAAAQTPVDLNTWAYESYPSSDDAEPVWGITPDGLSAVQRTNAYPSLLYGDFVSSGLTLRADVTSGGDDNDFIGFAVSYRPDDSDFLLIDWKARTQVRKGQTGREGLAVSQVFGDPMAIEFWEHVDLDDPESPLGNGLVELARGVRLGNDGWHHSITYHVDIELSASSLRVYVDGWLEIDIDGDFCVGRPGLYAYSQPAVVFSNVTVEAGPSAVMADAGEDVHICEGELVFLSATASTWPCGCPIEALWRDGVDVVADWSTDPGRVTEVSPSRDTVYTLELRCVGELTAASSDDILVAVEQDVLPESAGNTLLAVKVFDEIDLRWRVVAGARTYNLYRSNVKESWPSTPIASDLDQPALILDTDLESPPDLYFYRATAVSCLGAEGP